MKKKLSKKIIIITASIFVIVIGITCSLIWLKNNKKDNDVADSVKELQSIKVLNVANEAEAANLVKQNIVKIINVFDDEKTIGTGFFIEDGYLITNSHVVDIEGSISIEYPDGSTDEAILISNDIISDIALLYVAKPKVLAMAFGNTMDLNITDTVFAIGYAYNLVGEASVTKGILSARRSAVGVEYLQTDASINTGSSGGPLINSKAELVGMNSLASENASIGMAISSESLKNIIYKLILNKKVTYIEEDRPQNALSVVLVEVGYNTDDLYNEKKHLTNKKKDHDQNNDNEQNNNEQSNSSSNNKNNNNQNSNNNTSNSTIETKLITKLDRATGIISGLDTRYNASVGVNCFILHWDYIDSDRVRLSVPYGTQTDIFSEVIVDVYAGQSQYDSLVDPSGKPLRFLKNYIFTPTKTSQAEVFIPINDIRSLLSDEDYYGINSGAYLTFRMQIITREQGNFSSQNGWELAKQ